MTQKIKHTFYEIVYFIYFYNLTNFDKIIVFHNISPY